MMDFKVGDLVALKDYHNGPVAIVLSTAALWLNRMQIEYICDGEREMIDPRHLKVVSRNETR